MINRADQVKDVVVAGLCCVMGLSLSDINSILATVSVTLGIVLGGVRLYIDLKKIGKDKEK